MIPFWTSFSKTTPAKTTGTVAKTLGAVGFVQSVANPSLSAASPTGVTEVVFVKLDELSFRTHSLNGGHPLENKHMIKTESE